jgi:hypothetical protein
VLDSSEREIVIDKMEYIGPGREVAIGRRGGKISNGVWWQWKLQRDFQVRNEAEKPTKTRF